MSNPTVSQQTSTSKSTSNKSSKWAKQKAKRKRRKKRKKLAKSAINQQEKKLIQQQKLLNQPKDIEIDYVSETLNETAIKSFSDAFNRFTRAEDLFKTPEQLEKEEIEKELKEKQKLKEEEEKLRSSDPIDAAIPNDAKNNNKNDNNDNKNGNNNNSNNNNSKNAIVSNKKKKIRNRPTIAQLKKDVLRPDLVEEHDVNAPDPWLLIRLKSMRNSVPVPAHWLQKRKYLQGKRGYLKPPFKLPSYIEQTGITKMRESRLNLLSSKTAKQKQREKVRPKKGGLEISYNILHEAFFKLQTKPENMTQFGDLYYEGKEHMIKFRRYKPGYVSDKLKKALSMVPRYRVVSPSGALVQNRREIMDDDGSGTGEYEWYDVQTLKYGQYVVWDENSGPKRIKISAPCTGFIWLSSKDNREEILKRCNVEDPPPWLINMQRFGPPPSYPDLKIPGLNAPIPTHKMYGFHDGQWGKPPVDENGQPLYGDPFGIWTEPISKSWGQKSRWGVLQKFDETSDEESESDEDEDDDDMDNDVGNTQNGNNVDVDMIQKDQSGITSSTSIISNTPSEINLRKNVIINNNNLTGIITPTSGISTDDNKELYKILQPQQNKINSNNIFGSSTVYQIPSPNINNKRKNITQNNDNQPPLKKRKQNN